MKEEKEPAGYSEKIDSHLKPGEHYEYKDSGIVERVGTVPLWLRVVYAGLIIWGIYYIIRYWSG